MLTWERERARRWPQMLADGESKDSAARNAFDGCMGRGRETRKYTKREALAGARRSLSGGRGGPQMAQIGADDGRDVEYGVGSDWVEIVSPPRGLRFHWETQGCRLGLTCDVPVATRAKRVDLPSHAHPIGIHRLGAGGYGGFGPASSGPRGAPLICFAPASGGQALGCGRAAAGADRLPFTTWP